MVGMEVILHQVVGVAGVAELLLQEMLVRLRVVETAVTELHPLYLERLLLMLVAVAVELGLALLVLVALVAVEMDQPLQQLLQLVMLGLLIPVAEVEAAVQILLLQHGLAAVQAAQA
jgi:hypothetical protein